MIEACNAEHGQSRIVSRPVSGNVAVSCKVHAASYVLVRLELRGTPGSGRVLALPVGCLASAALVGGLAWTALAPHRLLGVAAVTTAAFGIYALVRALRLLSGQRRMADDWLRSATAFVPPEYVWRAEQLCSPRERRMLARTLRGIEQMADERPLGRRRPLYLPAVREHRSSVQVLARALESLEEPVTPAGMLRVVDLVTDGAGPLWATTKDAALGDTIAATLAILTPAALASSRGTARPDRRSASYPVTAR